MTVGMTESPLLALKAVATVLNEIVELSAEVVPPQNPTASNSQTPSGINVMVAIVVELAPVAIAIGPATPAIKKEYPICDDNVGNPV